jgi:anti-sigma-K factor RskA
VNSARVLKNNLLELLSFVMTWDEVKELGPLYALGALDAETAQKVEVFLRHATKDQQSEITEWREVAALLPVSLPPAQTPSFLRERLLARLAGEGALSNSFPPGSTAKVLQFQPLPRAPKRTSQWLAIAAAIVLAITTAFLAWKNSQLSSRLNIAEGQVKEFLSSDTRFIYLEGVKAPQANAKVVWNKKSQKWKVYVHNLPVPSNDKNYQLWYVTKDAKINASVFSPNEQGNAELDLSLPPEAIQGLSATAVTLEPKGGSAQPTSDIYYLLAKI